MDNIANVNSRTTSIQASDTLVYALGGLNEVGKNMYVYEHEDEILIVDCGVMFPDETMWGVDYVIPDIQHLIKNQNKIKSLVDRTSVW